MQLLKYFSALLISDYSAMLFRVDNEVIFEEIKTLERYSSGCATILEKEGKEIVILICV